jgi:hypothetical protein
MPPEPDMPYRNVRPELEQHATAIGYVCFAWADLETEVDLFIETALGCTEDAARAVNSATGQFSHRCLLLYQIVSEKPPSSEWLASFEQIYKEMTEELASARNRLIHDAWTARPEPRQTDYSAHFGKPEAGAPKALLPIRENARTVEWLWQLERRIKRAAARLSLAREDYLLWRETGPPPEHPTQ